MAGEIIETARPAAGIEIGRHGTDGGTLDMKAPRDEAAAVVERAHAVAAGDNLRRSLNALASGGRISLIGLLQGLEFQLSVIPFLLKRATLEGILVGHRRAFAHLDRGPFGKVVIEVRQRLRSIGSLGVPGRRFQPVAPP